MNNNQAKENRLKERFSLAIVRMITAIAGYQLTEPEEDIDSIDGSITSDTGVRPILNFQAKASSQNLIKNNHIHYPVPIKNYNDLRVNAINPRILIVTLTPKNRPDRLSITQDSMVAKYCAYYYNLKNEPDVSNIDNKTVEIPLANIFTPQKLTELMNKIEKEGKI